MLTPRISVQNTAGVTRRIDIPENCCRPAKITQLFRLVSDADLAAHSLQKC